MQATRLLILLAGIGGLLWTALPVHAKDKMTGTTGGQILKLDVGARAAAMGGAFSPIADDLYAVNYNPSGLNRLGTLSLGMMHHTGLAEVSYDYLGYTQRLKTGYDEEVKQLGVMGISLAYLYMNELEGSRFAQGGGFERAANFKADFSLFILSYGFKMNPSLSTGFNLKMIKERIEKEEGSSIAFDLGLLYDTNLPGLTFGLCLQNIGRGLEFINHRAELPMNLRGGVAYKLLNNTLILCLELNKHRDNDLNLTLGTEYWLIKPLALRAGYKTDADIGGGFSGGVGIKIMNYSLDYAFAPYGRLGNAQRLSMLLCF